MDRPFSRAESLWMSAVVAVASGFKAVLDYHTLDTFGFVVWALVCWFACVLFIERGLEQR